MIVFLQNAWSPVYAGTVWPRPSWLRALARSRSGRRLRLMIDDFKVVHNVAPICGKKPSSVTEVNQGHVRRVLEAHKPEVVVACGTHAELACRLWWHGPLLCVPHPAHRVLTNALYAHARRLLDEGFALRYALRQERDGVHVEVLS